MHALLQAFNAAIAFRTAALQPASKRQTAAVPVDLEPFPSLPSRSFTAPPVDAAMPGPRSRAGPAAPVDSAASGSAPVPIRTAQAASAAPIGASGPSSTSTSAIAMSTVAAAAAAAVGGLALGGSSNALLPASDTSPTRAAPAERWSRHEEAAERQGGYAAFEAAFSDEDDYEPAGDAGSGQGYDESTEAGDDTGVDEAAASEGLFGMSPNSTKLNAPDNSGDFFWYQSADGQVCTVNQVAHCGLHLPPATVWHSLIGRHCHGISMSRICRMCGIDSI